MTTTTTTTTPVEATDVAHHSKGQIRPFPRQQAVLRIIHTRLYKHLIIVHYYEDSFLHATTVRSI